MENISDDEIDALTEKIIGCAITVHTELGPGPLESIYRDARAIELELAAPPNEEPKCPPSR